MTGKRTYLPHKDVANHYQFITFRTHDSIDHFVKKIAQQNSRHSKQQLAIDQYLDQSDNGAYLKGEVLQLLSNYLRIKNGAIYDLCCFTIMPNHVHLLIKPLNKLATVMQQIKGGSAKLINEKMERKGRFWAREYYDKLIRDDKHFEVVYQYIKNNPVVLNEAKASSPRFYSIHE
jgi:REP element-mobilizing transposase RayT